METSVKRKWSIAEKGQLKIEYIDKRMPMSDIAKLHKRSISSVKAKIRDLDLYRKYIVKGDNVAPREPRFYSTMWSIAETTSLIKEVEKGMSLGQIADLHKRPEKDITKKLRQISKDGVWHLPSQMLYDMETLSKTANGNSQNSPTIASFATEEGKLKALQERRDKVFALMQESVDGWISHQREYNNLSMHIERLEVSLGIKKTEYDYQADSLPMQYQSAFNNMNYRF